MDFDEDDQRPFTAEQMLMEALGMQARLSAELQLALAAKGGPLHDLVQEHRAAALTALRGLIQVNPDKPREVASLQETIKHYLRDCEWVQTRLADGAEADAQIKEIWGDRHDDRDQDGSDAG